ncbi:MAG: hypothetical protein A3K19_06120 [Lentisphaerae bacterium RIFOXYB12_FULL_65_16]|nr:MAG: hypothetical protein A3K18_34720 [Lentisphaerae bacterium RIFOXYA12_64_32]OGV94047.1 MAG: hypothetical protein A3K19_06120 [Lentisphaerae bacterium RIFOXYB12_FULL_65_16]
MQLKTVDELKALSAAADRQAKTDGQAVHIWGDMNIPPPVVPKGRVLYEDAFASLDNWHHEGIGQLATPEPGIFELACVGSKQGAEGCMAFCRNDFPDNICIEYDLRALTNKGLVITFIAAQGRHGEDIITGLPKRQGVFADYIFNPNLRCYHLSVSRYDDKGEHTGVSNWRRNPGIFLMAQQPDLCKVHDTWYHIVIVKQGKLLQLSVNGEPAGGFVDRDDIPEPIPAAGKIGFRTIGADVRVQFRAFKVTALE